MVGFAHVARLHHQAGLRAQAVANQAVVHRSRGQQRRHGCVLLIKGPVGQNKNVGSVAYDLLRPIAQGIQRLFQRSGFVGGRKDAV